jgi:alkanesulfonate monooxygenase SsuD/methylene tetrahydromethanopterin reductase-like flavin-dependent oxidoreductase (luciferase family)
MRDYLDVVRTMVRANIGDSVTHQGEIHSIVGWPPQVAPRRPSIPVILAATSPMMVELAGVASDGIALGSLLSVDYLRETILPNFERAADGAGRDPATLLRYAPVFTSVSADREEARQGARLAVCNLYAVKPHPHYDRILRWQGFTAVADALTAAAAEGTALEAGAVIPDELIDTLMVCGDVQTCARRIREYAEILDKVLMTNVSAMKYHDSAQQSPSAAMVQSYGPLFDAADASALTGSPA